MPTWDLNLKVLIETQNEASKELAKVSSSIKQIQDETKKSARALDDRAERNRQTFQTMSIAWGVAFGAISFGIKESLDAASELNNAMTGLKSIVNGTGKDFSKAQAFLEKFTADWLVPMSDAATALKNLLARWFGLEEATGLMDRFKDSAAFGRQASLSLGEAVKSATEGLKNENSILVDNAWVTKNVSVMRKEYADQIGVWVWELTTAQKRQAEINGIMKETQFQVGDAKKLSQEYSWQVALMNAEMIKLKQTIGAALMPIFTQLLQTLQPLIAKTTDWITKHPELTKNIIIVAGAVTGLVAVLWTLGLLVPAITAWVTALWAVIAFIGWPITAAIAIAAALYAAWQTNFFGIRDITNEVVNFVKAKLDATLWRINDVIRALRNLTWSASTASSVASTSLSRSVPSGWARASWWPVSPDKSYLVGERWPELFVPKSSWTIIPNWSFGMNVSINLGGVVLNNWTDEMTLVERIRDEVQKAGRNIALWAI